jgi:hypothetical protein
MKKVLFCTLTFLFVSLISYADTESEFPKSAKQQKRDSYGSIFGNNGFQLFGKGSKSNNQSNNSTTSANAFLWQAALDTISFMPLASTDYNGGIINTDWYDDKDLQDVMYKVTIMIKSPQLSVNALTVKVFKRKFRDGRWHDVTTSNDLAIQLEDKILARARALKVTQEETK